MFIFARGLGVCRRRGWRGVRGLKIYIEIEVLGYGNLQIEDIV
jgi:hypothetical protein